ncbi:MAG TPA: F0F1 ATP synthase subunit delta [Sedimenticola sp.]|nr:F0F1 ATP synthase subunit delta [Sedimenticola sp.]
MAVEAKTVARPYAEAVAERAREQDNFDHWSETLAFLTTVVKEPAMARLIRDPLFPRDDLERLMLDLGAERLDAEGRNLVRLLVQNGRLAVLPEIFEIYEQLKADEQQVLKVQVHSAYAVKPAQEKQIAAALKARLGREIVISSEKHPELIGGLVIRAGDLVIDGSVRGKLQRLANELEI